MDDGENAKYCGWHGLKIIGTCCEKCEGLQKINSLHNALYKEKIVKQYEKEDWQKYFRYDTPYTKYFCHHCKYFLSHHIRYCYSCSGMLVPEKISGNNLLIKYHDYKRGP